MFYVNVDDLKQLARDLKSASPVAAKAASLRMKAAAKIVSDEASNRVSYSKQISVRPSVTGVFAAKVVARGRPAAPIENNGAGFVRHPIFGNLDAWTAKGSHPAYLAPALDAKATELADQISLIIDDSLVEIGYR
jgi:hypothetical protein